MSLIGIVHSKMNANAFFEFLNCPICFEVLKTLKALNDSSALTSCTHTVCSRSVETRIEAAPTRHSAVSPERRPTVSGEPADGFQKNCRLAGTLVSLERATTNDMLLGQGDRNIRSSSRTVPLWVLHFGAGLLPPALSFVGFTRP